MNWSRQAASLADAGLQGTRRLRVAAAECVGGELFGGHGVRFGQQRRHALALHLIGETVEVVLLREVVGGTGEIAQQIAHSVVVLAVRETAERSGADGARLRCAEPVERRAQVGFRKLGEIVDPLAQRLFVGAVFLDPFAAGVPDSSGRFTEQQRLRGIGAIHQRREPEPERPHSGFGGLLRRKHEARGRGDAILVVAHAALGLLERRIDFVQEQPLLREGHRSGERENTNLYRCGMHGCP